MKKFLAGFFSVLFVFAIVGAVFWIHAYRCHSQWGSTFMPDFQLFSGCTITIDGVRIPAANYRVL